MAAPSGVLNINAVTPAMLQAVRMDQNQFQLGLGHIPPMPYTQEDRDELGRVRQKRLKIVRQSSILLLILSVMAIIDGIVAILIATEFPHVLGGGIIAGVPGLLIAGIGLWLTAEGKKTPTGDTTTPRFRCIVKCHLGCAFLLVTVIMTAWGIGAIWSLIDCATRTAWDDENELSINGCKPNTSTLTLLAVITLCILTIQLIVFVVNTCSYCCVFRAFGFIHGYERLRDMQMASIAAINRTQVQTQQPVSVIGQQQQPMNVYGQQQPMSMYGQQQPLANMYGQQQPPANMYGQQQPPANMYGQQQPPANMYGQQQPPANIQSQLPAYVYGQPIGHVMANQEQFGGNQAVNSQGAVPATPVPMDSRDDITSKSDPPPSYSTVSY